MESVQAVLVALGRCEKMMKQTTCYSCDKPIEPEWLPEGEFIVCDECLSETDELSVEKLHEQLNTAKKALTEIAEIIDDNIHECNYGCDNNCELNGSLDMYSVENVQSVIDSALAAIGGKELGVDLVKVVEG